MIVKGKTASGQAVTIKVASDGTLELPPDGFGIAEFDEIEVSRDGDDLVDALIYKHNSATVATLEITRADGLITNIKLV
jgi:hypothetical protein